MATTARLLLEKLVAGASTRANLLSYWNSNADILDTLITGTGISGGQTINGGTGSGQALCLSGSTHASKGPIWLDGGVASGIHHTLLLTAGANDMISGPGIRFEHRATANWYAALIASMSVGFGANWGHDLIFYVNNGSSINNLTEAARMLSNGSLWIANNCSALSFTDRTPGFEGDALAEISKVRAKDGGIDHHTLPKFAQRTEIVRGMDGKEKIEDRRDIGAMVSILTKAVQQLTAKLEAAESKIAKLESTKVKA